MQHSTPHRSFQNETTYKVMQVNGNIPAWYIRWWLIIKAICQRKPKPVFSSTMHITVQGRPFHKGDVIVMSKNDHFLVLKEVRPKRINRWRLLFNAKVK